MLQSDQFDQKGAAPEPPPDRVAAPEPSPDRVAPSELPPDRVVASEPPTDPAPASGLEDHAPVPEPPRERVVELDPAIALLSAPISDTDPCGPDLDAEGDPDYFNFLARVDVILPMSFFSPEDGKPFDPATIDVDGQREIVNSLLARSRDIRLATVRARLEILNRDLGAFAVTIAAIAEWLDQFWDAVHPRAEVANLDARWRAIAALDEATVVFPLQYAPLVEARRMAVVTYRSWMIAVGEVKPRDGDLEATTATITEALGEADPAILGKARDQVRLLKASLTRINNRLAATGSSQALVALPALVDKILGFIDPFATVLSPADAAQDSAAHLAQFDPAGRAPVPPTSLVEATQALAAIAEYYSRSEPSSPTLPLVRQAHQLIGKSFFEVISILVPSQVDKAAFQIGSEQVFDVPVSKFSNLAGPSGPQFGNSDGEGTPSDAPAPRHYHIESRAQATALLDMVQRYFRVTEPSSPVPMLCERARALAERDFMAVLRDVLPKSALKNANADK